MILPGRRGGRAGIPAVFSGIRREFSPAGMDIS